MRKMIKAMATRLDTLHQVNIKTSVFGTHLHYANGSSEYVSRPRRRPRTELESQRVGLICPVMKNCPEAIQ